MLKRFFILIFVFLLNVNIAFCADDFNVYLKNLKFNIGKSWKAPLYNNKYTSDVAFKLYKDGSVSDVKLVKSSKITKMDNIAVNTIKDLYKQNPLPSFYNSQYIEIIVSLTNFTYNDLKNPNISYKNSNINLSDSMPLSYRNVKFKKIVFLELFEGESNYKENMKDLELNLSIQRALKQLN